jgi:hypothetical protein
MTPAAAASSVKPPEIHQNFAPSFVETGCWSR